MVKEKLYNWALLEYVRAFKTPQRKCSGTCFDCGARLHNKFEKYICGWCKGNHI